MTAAQPRFRLHLQGAPPASNPETPMCTPASVFAVVARRALPPPRLASPGLPPAEPDRQRRQGMATLLSARVGWWAAGRDRSR